MNKDVVIDADGLAFRAQLEPAPDGSDEEQTLLQLEDGAQFLVPTELLVKRADGRYDLRLKLREYAAQTALPDLEDAALDTAAGAEPQASAAATGDTVIPVVEERLNVGKRTLQNRVQLRKYVTERTKTADVPLFSERVEVEHVTINRPVDEPTPVRYEGDTMIVPLYEEVLVKQLMLVEEVRVTTRRSERHNPQEVTLRREEIEVTRTDGEVESGD